MITVSPHLSGGSFHFTRYRVQRSYCGFLISSQCILRHFTHVRHRAQRRVSRLWTGCVRDSFITLSRVIGLYTTFISSRARLPIARVWTRVPSTRLVTEPWILLRQFHTRYPSNRKISEAIAPSISRRQVALRNVALRWSAEMSRGDNQPFTRFEYVVCVFYGARNACTGRGERPGELRRGDGSRCEHPLLDTAARPAICVSICGVKGCT